uniref:Ovule protein n=1 Tax=Meloidogyne incognita TaxID=6306 RepID=A0A914MIC5_MELIC
MFSLWEHELEECLVPLAHSHVQPTVARRRVSKLILPSSIISLLNAWICPQIGNIAYIRLFKCGYVFIINCSNNIGLFFG